MKTYTCKYCHEQFELDSDKKASGFMSAHMRFCDKNPKKAYYEQCLEKQRINGNKVSAQVTHERNEATRRDYTFICEHCGNEYIVNLTAKQLGAYQKKHHFCGSKCSHSRVQTDEIRKKKSEAAHAFFLKRIEEHPELLKTKSVQHTLVRQARKVSRIKSCQLRKTVCLDCGKEIYVKTPIETYCYDCADNHPGEHRFRLYHADGKRLVSKKTVQKLTAQVRERVANGTHNGWKARPIASYPERFWKEVLNSNCIPYEFNKPIAKSKLGDPHACANYFLDFALPGQVDLEIDGSQHNRTEIHEKDLVRDALLQANGWKVYRVPWNEINTQHGKDLMADKIKAFLDWYKNIQKNFIGVCG